MIHIIVGHRPSNNDEGNFFTKESPYKLHSIWQDLDLAQAAMKLLEDKTVEYDIYDEKSDKYIYKPYPAYYLLSVEPGATDLDSRIRQVLPYVESY